MPRSQAVLDFIDDVWRGDYPTIADALHREMVEELGNPMLTPVTLEQARRQFAANLEAMGWTDVEVTIDPDAPATLTARGRPPDEILMTFTAS
jgi:hypothetical protein